MWEIVLFSGKFTQLAQILHDRQSWRSWQISTLLLPPILYTRIPQFLLSCCCLKFLLRLNWRWKYDLNGNCQYVLSVYFFYQFRQLWFVKVSDKRCKHWHEGQSITNFKFRMVISKNWYSHQTWLIFGVQIYCPLWLVSKWQKALPSLKTFNELV